jgi:hypothetical protein
MDIAPAPTDAGAFLGATCPELATKRAKRMQALVFSGMVQDHISDEDKTRTLGIPTPMGSLFDESRENQIARLKGELHAIDAGLASLNCEPDYR